ncbi:UpxY family transcription antiterminator [Maribellus comscasis]|uniref:UpxY family transcription antiterminator n=1 Tax=Maribellus comscasis TaxID=2681766 RepID=A0A6I6K4R7_9BACT|nr:UpxY family transcription antiterminator [Maribellus comscasis]QGY46593.1 UpxY family transcription antiterminator [Maribellus comscasis]
MKTINTKREKYWHVIYTRSRAEKKVWDELTIKGIESFLPLQKKLRQWKDRKKWVEMPLMSGYCFVRISLKDYDEVLKTSNVVCYITFEGKAAIIPDQQIDALKQMLKQQDFDVSVSHETFEPGKQVEIIEGPMLGMRGELMEIRGKNKFILRFQQINSVFTAEVPASHLSFLPNERIENKTIH